MKKNIFFIMGILCLLFSLTFSVKAENYKTKDACIVGHVVDKKTGEHLPYIAVALKGTTVGTMTDKSGHYFMKDLPLGTFELTASAVGYKTQSVKVVIKAHNTLEVKFSLDEDMISLDNVVVTANRCETVHRLAPTLVNVVSAKVFDQTSSTSLSQGLIFQPGVRVESDCQNCGFSQVRINGMEGKYTQILINSRPIFSALAGVYGLEQIPANMIDRVEVVRGGGSALFGSSAIAGTINIITKDPTYNSGSIGHTISKFDNSNSYENNTTLNLSLISPDNKLGVYVYGQNRERTPWDQNGDAFSELPKLKNQTLGLNGFYRTGTYSKLNFEYHHMNEFRRGGSGQSLPPHIAVDGELNGMGEDGIVEQISHSINTGSLNFSGFSKDQKHNYSIYASAQKIDRDSYYGGYGKTSDMTGVVGAQYMYKFGKCLFMPSDLTLGTEFNHDNLKDRATDYAQFADKAKEDPAYNGNNLQDLLKKYTPDPLHQTIDITSGYLQNEWKSEQWSILLGGRVDKNSIMDKAIFSPRANLRFNPSKSLSFRLSYAEGFRAPQAFDEDLHTGSVGGDRVITIRNKDLKEERSYSYDASIDWYKSLGDLQFNLLLEGFYTKLKNQFIFKPLREGETGELIQERVNGSGSKVYGMTLEGKIAYQNKIQFQAGVTAEKAKTEEQEAWGVDKNGEDLTSKNILRTPDIYGYFTASYNPTKALTFAVNGNYTGHMYVPHHLSEVIEDVPTSDILVKSPTFFELGAKISYDFHFTGNDMQLNLGVKNILNSYQDDFDTKANRDSEYIYGPGMPRVYYASVKVSF